MAQIQEVAFPRLTSAEVALVKPLATARDYADGETIFRAGQADIDLVIVEMRSGRDPESDGRPAGYRRS